MFHILFQRLNKFYETLFKNYGSFLSKYYIYTISTAFLLNMGLSLGLLRMNWINDVDQLFMPVNSEARKVEAMVKRIFNETSKLTQDSYLHQLADLGTYAELNFQPCQLGLEANKPENILQAKYIEEILKINDFILTNTVATNSQGQIFRFEDVCARRFNECVVDGIDLLEKSFYENWLQNVKFQKIRTQKESLEMKDKNIDDEREEETENLDAFRFYIKLNGDRSSLTDLSFMLGRDFRINEDSNSSEIGYARVVKLRYSLKSHFENADPDVVLWEAEFVKNMLGLIENTIDLNEQCQLQSRKNDKSILKNLRVTFSTSQSMELEMAANMSIDTKLIVGTFVLIIMFSIILMSIKSNCLTSPGYMLPLSGILSAVFGMSSAFGLLSLVGYHGCKLVLVVPFLVIGLGIDDMFIIYSSFVNTNSKRRELRINKNDIIKTTLARSGVSITLTSLTDFVAFLVGVTTDFPGVQIFCVYAGFSILFCYFYQLTFFAGFLCIHLKRVEKKFNAFVPCVKQASLNKFVVCAKGTCFSAKNADDELREESDVVNENNSSELVELKPAATKTTAKTSSYRKNSKYDEKEKIKHIKPGVHTKVTQFFARIFEFLVCTWKGKSLTFLLYLVYIGLSVWSASRIKEGMNLADLVADDSYFSAFVRENLANTDINPIVMFVITEPIDYDNQNVRNRLSKFLIDASKIEGLNKKFRLNWLDYFRNAKIKYKKSLKNLVDVLKNVPPMLNDIIVNKVYFDKEKNVVQRTLVNSTKNLRGLEFNYMDYLNMSYEYQIVASRFYMQYNSLYFSSQDAVPMHTLRILCSESGLPIFPYSITFKYYEQFEQTLPNIIQSFIISIEAMYIIALFFIPDLVSVFCIIISMLSIMIGLIGCMQAWGLTLSSITMIELIMSIGFCIDFSAHIVHSFLANSGQGSRNQRALKAIMHVGVPILNSAVSTVLGVLMLAFCKSFIFLTFCKSMLIIMSLGVLNSLIFLPVMLSVVGPHWPRHKEPIIANDVGKECKIAKLNTVNYEEEVGEIKNETLYQTSQTV